MHRSSNFVSVFMPSNIRITLIHDLSDQSMSVWIAISKRIKHNVPDWEVFETKLRINLVMCTLKTFSYYMLNKLLRFYSGSFVSLNRLHNTRNSKLRITRALLCIRLLTNKCQTANWTHMAELRGLLKRCIECFIANVLLYVHYKTHTFLIESAQPYMSLTETILAMMSCSTMC